MEDFKLIRNCQKGNKAAFQELITKYHPLVSGFLIKLTRNAQHAEDLTQDTFLKVIKNIEKFDLNKTGKFSTYIITIAKNCYLDEIKKEVRYKRFQSINAQCDTGDPTIDLEETIINKLDGQAVLDSLENLTEEQQIVIKLKYIEELTLKEIGRILNLEPKTVKSRIHNGVEKLRGILKRSGKYGVY